MTFLLCDPGWCVHVLYRKVKSDVQNKWDDNKQTKTVWSAARMSKSELQALRGRLFDVLPIYPNKVIKSDLKKNDTCPEGLHKNKLCDT